MWVVGFSSRRGDMAGLRRRNVGCVRAVGVDSGMVTKISEGVVYAGLTVRENVVHGAMGVCGWGGGVT